MRMVIISVMVIAGLTAAMLKPAQAAPKETIDEARDQARQHLQMMFFRINSFHHDVKNSMRSTLELPVFKDYFSLPESKHNLYDKNGIIQSTKAQIYLRKQIQTWTASLNKRFVIGEMCLVDKYGQEHFRSIGDKNQESHLFSDQESDAPFFDKTMTLKSGEILFTKPYMSPDSYHWVVAVTSPIILDNGEKPGFFHFEIPISSYSTIVKSKNYSFAKDGVQLIWDSDEEGRYFIVNKKGLLIADSKQHFSCKLKPERNPELNPDLSDYAMPEMLKDYYPKASSISNDKDFLKIIERMRNGENGEVVIKLDGIDYIIIFKQIPGFPWTLAHIDPVNSSGFWTKDEPKQPNDHNDHNDHSTHESASE